MTIERSIHLGNLVAAIAGWLLLVFEAAAKRERAIAGLKKMLATPPLAAANTVLISHGYNLWDTEGFHLGTQGEAAIYRPDGNGGYVLVARLTPDHWEPLPAH